MFKKAAIVYVNCKVDWTNKLDIDNYNKQWVCIHPFSMHKTLLEDGKEDSTPFFQIKIHVLFFCFHGEKKEENHIIINTKKIQLNRKKIKYQQTSHPKGIHTTPRGVDIHEHDGDV